MMDEPNASPFLLGFTPEPDASLPFPTRVTWTLSSPSSDLMNEPDASAAQRKELQIAAGYLLYYGYGRTVDAR